MSRPSSPRLAFSQLAPVRRTGAAQMSQANAFEGRGRWPGAGRQLVGRLSARTITFASTPDRDDFMDAWRRFIRATTKSRTDCAKVYDKTFQTACNWYDGTRIPTGDVVAHAFTLHPALAVQLLTGV